MERERIAADDLEVMVGPRNNLDQRP